MFHIEKVVDLAEHLEVVLDFRELVPKVRLCLPELQLAILNLVIQLDTTAN